MGVQRKAVIDLQDYRRGYATLTDPQAKEIAKDIYITAMPMQKCSTIAEKVCRGKDLIEYWATQEDWIELRKVFQQTRYDDLVKEFGDTKQAVKGVLELCDIAQGFLKNYAKGKIAPPVAESKDFMITVELIHRVQSQVHKEIGAKHYYDMTGGGSLAR